jgi:plastocyanin
MMRSSVVSRKIPSYLVGLSIASLAIVTVVGAIVGAQLRTATASTTPIEIRMIDTPPTFQPSALTVKVGDTVEWKNVGTTVHHASTDSSSAINPADVSKPSSAKPFDSGFLQPGQSFTYTFTVPGKYKYICAPHETSGMSGEITVK